MEYLPAILTVAIVHLLAVISPGPDFLLIVRNSLVYSRRTGIYSSLGLAFGILVHIAYCMVGIGVLISNSILLFNLLKFLGAAYLIYLGVMSLISKSSHLNVDQHHQTKDLSPMAATRSGFLTNVTNPKATLFFLSLFTLVISPNTPIYVKLFMALEMFVVQFIWFSFVAYMISHPLIKQRLGKVQNLAEKFIGVVLIALGIKVAFSSK